MELRGISCIEFEDIKPKKEIMASRSFGRRITKREELEEALAMYASRAGEKLRKQGSVTGRIMVIAMTSLFNKNKPKQSHPTGFRIARQRKIHNKYYINRYNINAYITGPAISSWTKNRGF